MSATDTNKAIRSQQSREAARDAAEAYKAACSLLWAEIAANHDAIAALLEQGVERGPAVRALREQSRDLVRQSVDLGLPRAVVARRLGVSRQTVHDWINEKEN